MRKREIDRKFDEIVAFAEIETFLDMPVKRYSSGMYVRLAFAVAAHLDPEILIVDEVLAVGDVSFQKKCLGKMDSLAGGGRTVLLVSHNLAVLRQIAPRCVCLKKGRLHSIGPSDQAIGEYMQSDEGQTHVYDGNHLKRLYDTNRNIEFLKLWIEGSENGLVSMDDDILVFFQVSCRKDTCSFRFSMTIFRWDETPVGNWFGSNTLSLTGGEKAVFRACLRNFRLAEGKYHCAVAVGLGDNASERIELDIVSDVLHFEVLPEVTPDGYKSHWTPGWGSIRFPTPEVQRID